MIEDDTVYLTPEGLKQIEEELAYLKTTRREEIAAKLETAIKQGDLKENADYHDAKEEQGFIEGRIRQLEDSLRRAKVIDNRGPANVVRVGSTVTVTEVGVDEEETYVIAVSYTHLDVYKRQADDQRPGLPGSGDYDLRQVDAAGGLGRGAAVWLHLRHADPTPVLGRRSAAAIHWQYALHPDYSGSGRVCRPFPRPGGQWCALREGWVM